LGSAQAFAADSRPEANLLICHGVLVPRARWRRRLVDYERVAPGPTRAAGARPRWPRPQTVRGNQTTPCARNMAALIRQAFGVGVLACMHCGGRLRLIATLHDPAVITWRDPRYAPGNRVE
jgi:hypothetical protein